jgi:hypothetical protein
MQRGTLLQVSGSRMPALYSYRPPPQNFPFRVAAPTIAGAIGAALPNAIDLRNLCRPSWTLGQGQTLACTGFASAAFREVTHAAATGTVLSSYLSPMYIYAYALMYQGQFGSTSAGSSIAEEFYILANYGDCPEPAFPYDSYKPGMVPTPSDDLMAYPFRLSGAGVVDVSNVNNLKAVLANRQPVAISFSVFPSFEHPPAPGAIPMANTSTEPCLGGHAVLVVGYDDTAQYWIVRNSWGTAWGDNGYCYMPYGYEMRTWIEAWSAPSQP